MSVTRHCLLDEALLSVEMPGSSRSALSLPDVLAQLGAGVELEFAALQAHQFHAWYAFLVQLAALALHHAAETAPPTEPERWKALLLALTDGQPEPWCLVVEDLSRPAFFQPPVPEGTIDALKKVISSPDGMDVLITAKNHDLKAERIVRPQPQHWLYALVCLQTMEGFLGAGNYGVSRMNGGFASRPALAASSGLSWPRRWIRDVAIWLDARQGLIERYDYRAEGGHALIWLLPWDGTESLGLRDCDPFYLEVCRRMRLVLDRGAVVARGASSKAARIAAKEAKGDTGDIWTPIRVEDGASLTVSGAGFTYKLMQELLFTEDYKRSAAMTVLESDGNEITLSALCLVRGQGKTEGYQERILPIPRKSKPLLMSRDGRARLGTVAKRWVEAVANLQKRVLRPALCVLLQGGPDKPDLRDERTGVWTRQLDEQVDAIFFDRLWNAVDRPPEETDPEWGREIVTIARQILQEAMYSVPLPSVRRYRAMARAEGMFEGGARKHFGEAASIQGGKTDAD